MLGELRSLRPVLTQWNILVNLNQLEVGELLRWGSRKNWHCRSSLPGRFSILDEPTNTPRCQFCAVTEKYLKGVLLLVTHDHIS